MRKLITLLAAGALVVPAATAAPTHGKPSGPKACHGKAKVMVVLKGLFVAAAADGSSLQLNANHANRHGRPYLKAPQPLTVGVDAKTRFVKNGAAAKLTDLAANDRLVVLSKTSRCDLRSASDPASLPALTARMVVDQGPTPASDSSDSESSGS
jgi:hypothetical protein